MKRWRDRDYDPEQDGRDEEAAGPLMVERLGSRTGRSRYVLPGFAAIFIVMALVAISSRFIAYFSSVAASAAPPTPITWVNGGVDQLPTATPAISMDPEAPSLAPVAPRSLHATIPDTGDYYWPRGKEGTFTLTLVNRTNTRISLTPCPIYRMYTTGSDASAAPLHMLNCAEIGRTLEPGARIELQMVYVPTKADEIGRQTLAWEWVWPDSVQAFAITNVYIGP